ncbi:MAG: ABC transporter permease [Chloroflexota bacterium]|nr:ABC transporter permease [Chloroflexota bacterium]
MGAYIIRRTLRMAVILLAASIAVFYALRFASGDPSGTQLNPVAREEVREEYREKLGLNEPIYRQYLIYMGNVLQGDFGRSLVNGATMPDLLTQYGKNSLILGLTAFLLTQLIGIPLGMLAAARRNGIVDGLISGFSVLGMGIPNFWLALLLILIFSSKLHWLPSSGCCGPNYLVMPAIVLAAEGTAVTVRMMRSSMLEQLGQDFVRTHRAKGLSEFTIIGSRVSRNALIPVISLAGLRLGWVVGYALIVETIFRWTGVGFLLVDSVIRRDYPVAQFFSLVLVLIVCLANLLADLAYGLVDPRIREA